MSMTKTEIMVNDMIAESISKLIEKYQKKADKEREKVSKAYVTYKGEKFFSESDLMDAYSCDMFSDSTYDRLLDKLNKAKDGISGKEMTESEIIVFELQKHRNNLLHEVAFDKHLKEKQAQTDERIKELTSNGYSIREAETIVGNEELMRYE